MGHSKDLEVPLPDKKIGGRDFIFKVIFDLYHSLQKNKVLLAFPASENKHTRLNDAFKEIGI